MRVVTENDKKKATIKKVIEIKQSCPRRITGENSNSYVSDTIIFVLLKDSEHYFSHLN